MTIQEYLSRIEGRDANSMIAFPNIADLEFCVQKMQQNNAELSFGLDVLLQKTSKLIIVNTEVIKLFSSHLGLLFLEEKESGNVCFANSQEVRPEYRQSFRLIDFLDYVYAFIHSSVYKDSQKVILTAATDLFWKLVKIGSGLRTENR